MTEVATYGGFRYLCYAGPVAFAPAMAPEMWDHPAVRANFERLKEYGACIPLCPFKEMWPLLKALVENARKPPSEETDTGPLAGKD